MPPSAPLGCVASNGSLVYVLGGTGGAGYSLAWVSLTGQEEAIARPSLNYGDPRVSPDGTRVAVAITEQGNTDIWIWHLERETLTRLTFDEAQDATPLWTPDSSRVAFSSTRDGGGVFWKAADGTGEVERLLESRNRPRPWGWSADGRLIIDEVSAGGDIGVVDVEEDRAVELLLDTEFEEGVPALSPDGRWLAYQSDESGRAEIYVQPFPDIEAGKWQVSTNGGAIPVWSPDGQALFFYRPGQALLVADIETEPTFNPGTPTVAFSVSGIRGGGLQGRHYDVAPDGKRLLVRMPGTLTNGADPFTGMIFVENWFQELIERVPMP